MDVYVLLLLLLFPFISSRFITTNIRNELDYSPQTIYWLGGKFESNKHLKWNDGSNVTYKVCAYFTNNVIIKIKMTFLRLFVYNNEKKRVGFKGSVMLRKHQKKRCVSVCNGKYRVRQCCRLAYFGHRIIAQNSVAMCASARIKTILR